MPTIQYTCSKCDWMGDEPVSPCPSCGVYFSLEDDVPLIKFEYETSGNTVSFSPKLSFVDVEPGDGHG